jgi:hypothetical protein
MNDTYESEIGALLAELADVQSALLGVLGSLLHLSQMIEIIATGGRPKPTYEKGPGSNSGGALVDRAA